MGLDECGSLALRRPRDRAPTAVPAAHGSSSASIGYLPARSALARRFTSCAMCMLESLDVLDPALSVALVVQFFPACASMDGLLGRHSTHTPMGVLGRTFSRATEFPAHRPVYPPRLALFPTCRKRLHQPESRSRPRFKHEKITRVSDGHERNA